jgi:hypothetical protein
MPSTKIVITVDSQGTKVWTKNGARHRLDGPAIEYVNGSWIWMKQGLCHRECGPAVRHANGDKFWFIQGVAYSEEQVKLLAFVKGISYNSNC